ncbi:YfhJ family protein [Pullulanibacillus sp. KACC 23026]|uniref:YfhJ family protein n=1 Tax=Pullulanibacillus sp. KACC 23026 TaxID=3028315 RepID=UPI0023B0B7D2|nr:YfhJ family protein [Pullulanibacillus sp. KACC 23026]WEG12765.1 YfhJ family protein [Pullulanibacillus sp. KACC 23026]
MTEEMRMEWIPQWLTNLLLEVNDQLTEDQARTWVEAIWEDIDATRAKGGFKYRGKEQTAKQVEQWIRSHGKHIHHLSDDPKSYILNKRKGPVSQ